jgi:uncharacterized membrane protein
MKRARTGSPLAVLILLAGGMLALPAHADCSAEVQAIRAQLAAVKDPQRREELQMLLDKAEKDQAAGRTQLCGEAVQRARVLVKG